MKLLYLHPIKTAVAIFLFFSISLTVRSTTLTAGDLLFTGYFSNGSTTDEFSFVLLVDISGTTVINFTDNAWLSTNVFRVGEQTVTWTYTGTLVAGREIRISGPSAGAATAILFGGSSGNTIIGACSGAMPSFATSGDQIIAYSGTVGSPTLIAGLHMNVYSTDIGQCNNTTAASWDPTCITENANYSRMPLGLSAGTSALWIGTEGVGASEQDNGRFNCTGPLLTVAQLRTAVTNSANWTVSNVAPPNMTLPTGCDYMNLNLTLPLQLLSFEGTEQERQVTLKWQTAYEENHNHFEIEKSADAIHFTKGGRVEAQGGFSYLVTNYQYQDHLPLQGANYYRLKMVATDGRFEYSSVIKVTYNNAGRTLFVSPNPAVTHVYVSTREGRFSEVIISSYTGQIVAKQKLISGYQKIDVSLLAPGQYIITVAGDAEKVTEKLMIFR
ncbi:T9SS type A sorting domain-containing protein [Niastella caeni]|uniref:T9SS type A sorting domain-containing protein n=1 Tax=Niastella caeni TaxID=2569763 RepID=A0A4V4H1J6_9BACT|nr:T9SS type A sorting domain-containing protein [Niastella caeni]THU40776.1 T9SS type A sorting domain-containing protein [Niastella caeni]